MTNPEHNVHPQPRHLGETHSAVERIDVNQNTPEVRARLELGIARHGDAFAAFLTLADIDIAATDLLAQFDRFYYATFPDLRACADTFIEALGWQSSLEQLELNEPDIQGFLVWNYSLVGERINDLYEIVPYGGQVHLFDR